MRWLERVGRSWTVHLVVLLTVPAWTTGLVLDDYLLASRLHGPDGIRWQGLWDAFTFASGSDVQAQLTLGELPWWTDPALRCSFFRPLAALSHALDFAFLPPWCMHVESAAWLVALNVAVAHWYRRLLGAEHGLATALFVLAPGHTFAAAWLANRNAVLAALFAVLALSAYDRARCRGRSTWPAAGLLALALLAGEVGVGAVALWLAYACTLDEAADRWRALVPGIVVTLCWAVARAALGYGAFASPLYVDPVHEPVRFLVQLAEHLPLLLLGAVLPGVTFSLLLARSAALAAVGLASLVLLCLVPRLRALWREDSRARFGALAMLWALVPVTATVVHDRLLIVADIAGMGLLSQLVWTLPDRAARTLLGARVLLSGVLAIGYAGSLRQHIALGEAPFEHVLREPEIGARTVVFLNAPAAYYPLQLRRLRAWEGGPVPAAVRTLAPGIVPLTIERRDERTLRVHAPGGLLQPIGGYRAPGPRPGWFSPVFFVQKLDQVVRASWAYRAGDRVRWGDVEVVVVHATPDGYPACVDFVFEARALVFLAWRAGRYERFDLPELGDSVRLPAVHAF